MTCVPCCLFIRLKKSLVDKMKILVENHQWKVLFFWLCFSQLASYLIHSRTYWFKSRLNWKWKIEKILREDKIIIQSRDQANNSLDPDQSCGSSRFLYWFVIELLQQHRVILRVVWILWSSETQSPSTSLRNQFLHSAEILVHIP